MTRPTATSPLNNPSHSTLHNFHVNVKMFGATGDGTTDDTTAITSAITEAGSGGRVYFPPGTFRVGSIAPLAYQVWEGAGLNSTILKAKTSATEVIVMTGLVHCELRNLGIDGNAKASKGLVVQGSASVGSQGHLFSKCRFQNCSIGFHLATGTVSQADKNTYLSCRWADNTTGFHIDALNGQEQLILGGSFDTHTTAIRLTTGTLNWISSQVQTATTGLLIDGGPTGIKLSDVIMEAETISVDGNTGWLTTSKPLLLENCTLQGSSATLKIGLNGSVVKATGCTFNNGNINAIGNDTVLIDEFCTFASGASWNPTGSNCRRYKWDLNALSINQPSPFGQTGIQMGGAGAAAMDTNLYRAAADVLATDDALQLTELGSDAAAGAANTGRLYLKDNGSGKTQLYIRFASGAAQLIATEP